MIHASLCTGIGGLDLAAQHVYPGELSWYAEIDPHASVVLAERFPGVRNFGDFRNSNFAGPVDLLTAGFPCQDISLAGKGAGLAGQRSGLWFDVLDVIAGLRPPLLFLENVPAIRTRGLDVVLAGLEALGYGGRWCFYRSGYATNKFAHVGGCHQRKRWFLLAERGRRGFAEVIPDPDDWAGSPRLLPTPTASMSTGAGTQGRDGGLNLQTAVARLLPAPSASAYGSNRGGAAGRVGPVRHGLNSIDKLLYADTWGEYAAAVERWATIHGPPPSPVTDDNRLNPELPEWMLGYPPGWVTDLGISKTQQIKALGNSVQPQTATAALRVLAGAS